MQIYLAKCEYCGQLRCSSHYKYTDRCDDCGKRYSRFMSAKSRAKDEYGEIQRTPLLVDIEMEYERLMADGYKVPRYFKGGN